MFNYLAETEDEFFENWDDIQTKSIRQNSIQYFFKIKLFFLQQLFVPFSQNSFTPDNFNRFVVDIEQDVIYILVNFIAIYEFFNDKDYPTKEGLMGLFFLQVLSPIIISFGAIDLAFNLSVFLLSLVTRSIASLVYMLDYSLNPQAQNQDNNEDDHSQNDEHYYQYSHH